MPTAVLRQPSVVAPLLSGVSGAFSGAAEGEKFNEKRRQDDAARLEQQREHDDNMKFSYEQLMAMQREGKLNRDQTALLDQYRREQTTTENALGRTQETTENALTRAQTTTENAAQRKSEEWRTQKQVNAENYATQKRDEDSMRNFVSHLQERDRSTQIEQFDTIDQIVTNHPSMVKGTSEYEAAQKEWLTYYFPKPAPGVPVPSTQELQAAKDKFDYTVGNMPAAKKRVSDLIESNARSRSIGEAAGHVEGKNAVEGTRSPRDLRPENLVNLAAPIDELTGQHPLKYTLLDGDSPLKEYQSQIRSLQLILTDHASNMVTSAFEMTQAGMPKDQVIASSKLKIQDGVRDMKNLSSNDQDMLYQYFMDSLDYITGTVGP